MMKNSKFRSLIAAAVHEPRKLQSVQDTSGPSWHHSKIYNDCPPLHRLLRSGALVVIEANEGSSQTKIVELTGVDRSTLADMIKRLQKNKLIELRRSKEDARAYVVKLSEGGKQALAIGKPALATVEKGPPREEPR
jgi:hypothetical protein